MKKYKVTWDEGGKKMSTACYTLKGVLELIAALEDYPDYISNIKMQKVA